MGKNTLGETSHVMLEDGTIKAITGDKRRYIQALGDGRTNAKDIAKAADITSMSVYNYRRDKDLLEFIRQRAAKFDLTIDSVFETVADARLATYDDGKPDHNVRMKAAATLANMLGYLGPILAKQVELERGNTDERQVGKGVITLEEVRTLRGNKEEIRKRMTVRRNVAANEVESKKTRYQE